MKLSRHCSIRIYIIYISIKNGVKRASCDDIPELSVSGTPLILSTQNKPASGPAFFVFTFFVAMGVF